MAPDCLYCSAMGAARGVWGVLFALGVSLLSFPAVAGAASFNLEIDHALLDLGQIKNVTAIDPAGETPDPPATLAGTLTSGKVNIPRAGFHFPPKTGELTSGIDGTVSLTANRDITGRFDEATGELTLAFDLKASVVALGQTCVINPVRASLSTRYGRPYLGVPFSGGLAGTGALAGSWADLPAPTGGALCQIVGQLTVGPGGIWMARDLADARKCDDNPSHPGCDETNPCANGPTSQCCAAQPAFEPCHENDRPKLTLKVTPKALRAKAGRTATVTFSVRNSGTAAARRVRVCAVAPKGRRGRFVTPGGCRTGPVGPGGMLSGKLKLKLKAGATGSFPVKVKLSAPGLPSRTARVTIRATG